MNEPAANPFSGLKATLARLLYGGWLGLLLSLIYRRRITAALTALESLFAQWQAGTLPVPTPTPAPKAPRLRASAAHTPATPRAGRKRATRPHSVPAKPVRPPSVASAPRIHLTPRAIRLPPKHARIQKGPMGLRLSHAFFVTIS